MTIRAARAAAGLTLPQAARLIGVSPRTWSHWEAGKRLPPAERDAITLERVIAKLRRK